jgi:hypothetical protein
MTQGAVGELILDLISYQPINIKKPEKVTVPEIAIFPSNMKMPPTEEVNANSPAYLMISEKAFMAEVQKFSDVNATWI